LACLSELLVLSYIGGGLRPLPIRIEKLSDGGISLVICCLVMGLWQGVHSGLDSECQQRRRDDP
jgi:hypothetical protein